jgi:excinuclease ABC subunit C
MDIKNFSIPQTAGCYLFRDSKDQIIYVGKSKYLPKRVSSYFQKNHKDSKTIKLVTEIKNVDFISTDTENEALLLEEDLIKLYKPKFNIKGKDDRTIRSKMVLTGGHWKKIELFFPKEDFDGEVLAEFTSGKVAHEVYNIIHEVFKIRTCSYNLVDESIKNGRFKSCLEYHIGNCQAPCIGLASKIDYLFNIKLIKDIFQHNFKTSEKYFWRKMKFYSENLEFEKAQSIKEKIEKLKKLQSLINPLKLIKLREKTKLVQESLELKFNPVIIDAFDNSHTSGTEAVCGLVRFKLLQPEKSDWRKFIIKSGVGGDDYASFEEVLNRRFSRLISEKKELPNLVIIDGARPQLNVAITVLKQLNLIDKLDIISISKDDKHRASTIHTQTKDLSISGFNELAHILNEVHRFSLDFHKKRMTKKMFK